MFDDYQIVYKSPFRLADLDGFFVALTGRGIAGILQEYEGQENEGK
ncbi:MAG: hypothetical protein NTY19_45365 [Planctomycetota bacterium]|nr:hypothetical protein [Planctomycetota bacterium]